MEMKPIDELAFLNKAPFIPPMQPSVIEIPAYVSMADPYAIDWYLFAYDGNWHLLRRYNEGKTYLAAKWFSDKQDFKFEVWSDS